jgi:hypothetical protein
LIPIKRRAKNKQFFFDYMLLPHCIGELPNSDPEIRSIKYYKSTSVEEAVPVRIVKTWIIPRSWRPRHGAELMALVVA